MFVGLDEIDWSSMRHAYGPADAMPDVLRSLVSHRKSRRAWAHDYLWGAVHHQGDVYPCTVAAIPFLLAVAANPDARGRGGIVRLLGSIGGADRADPQQVPDGPVREAAQAVGAAYPTLVALLADRRAKVRAAAADALLACRDRTAAAVPALQARLAAEPDQAVRAAIVQTLGTIAVRADVPGLRAWLATAAGSDERADVRVAALTAWLRAMGDDDTGDQVPTILNLLEQTDADIREVSAALGGRVDDRIRLIDAVLRTGPRRHLGLARWAATRHMTDYRGDYRVLVDSCAELLAGDDPARRACATFVLAAAGPLAAPAADAMAEHVTLAVAGGAPAYDPDPAWQFLTGGPVWQLVFALAELGDPRAVPHLAAGLTQPHLPMHVGYRIASFGPAAAGVLLEPVRARLVVALAEDDRETADELLWTLIKLGAADEAVPVVLGWLDTTEPDRTLLWHLAAAGRAAAVAAPTLRRLALHPDHWTAINATQALWAALGDAEEALDHYRRLLPQVGAADLYPAVAELGDAGAGGAAKLAAGLHDELRRATRAGTDWVSAMRLWQGTGDGPAALPTLVRAWTDRRYAYTAIARCWAEMGPVAASTEPLLRAELADPRRATHDGSSSAIPDDEEFQATVRRALAAVTAQVTSPRR